ncbi:alpha-hydroxy acid oxidase [Catelliglobosispora koreensis]|uniref:alpha-hydroxy acid oxidase n=1 Tax=Catelliglobosispora koreensis TaxID=129052 RepID=UPI00036364E8|nr:alpha-hydroxy acid oxidase [Catelliglobosispora koreensis]
MLLEEFARIARERLSAGVWDFVEGGSGAELTVNANREILDAVQLRPRVLVDVSNCDTSQTLFGSVLSTPVGVAPTAYHRMVFDEGESATARGAGASGALFTVSIFASRSIEEIAAQAAGPLWLQVYWLKRRDVLAELAKRAEAAGYQALVLTVDTPRIGRRTRDLRNGFVIPPHVNAVNLATELMASSHTDGISRHADLTFDQSITWSDLAWLKGVTELPLLLKGILTAEDAVLAVEHGADGIIVSNHGGRQLDGAVPSLQALPEIAGAVNCPVLLDGGIRSGRDIYIALARGAKAVLIGRPVLWALAAGGADGVADLFTGLTSELELTMALMGTPTLGKINAVT